MGNKILILEQFSHLGGGQMVLIEVIQALTQVGYDCVVGVPNQGQLTERLNFLNVEWFIYPLGNYSFGRKTLGDYIKYIGNSIKSIIYVWKLCRSQRPALIYGNAPRTFAIASIVGWLLNIKVVWHLHLHINGVLERILCYIAAYIRLDLLIAVSKAVKESLPFISEDKIKIIYNGIDLSKFEKYMTKDRHETRQEVRLASIGLISPAKGHHHVIRACSELSAAGVQFKLLIVGSTAKRDKKSEQYLSNLKELVKQLDLFDNISFLGYQENIPELLSNVDILILASEMEAFPKILLEGLAAGCWIVATNVGGIPEVIEHGHNGYLFRLEDNEGIVNTIKSSLDRLKDHDLRKNQHLKASKYDLICFKKEIQQAIEIGEGHKCQL